MLREAIRLNPHDTNALSMLVAIYRDSKRTEDAVILLKQWIKDNPSNANPFMALAAIDVGMEKYAEAEEALKQGLQVEPSRTSARVALGELYTREGRTADAIDILKHVAVPLGPDAGFALGDIARAHFALGMAYVKSGDKNSAMDEYNVLKPKFSTMAEALLDEINK
jgi:tetratricopeptide (TPR) repeat protein